MRFLSRRSSLFALLSCLACALAAPYLLPVDPDSMVFRSGALPLILTLSAFFPLREAFGKADRRTLTGGLVFGLLLSIALSLGAELTCYDGFLPGLGSMLRRAAVPVLATPLLGGLAARCMMMKPTAQGRETPLLPWAGLLFLCWLPVLLAYWPGMLNYDFAGEYAQHADGYSTIHPMLHSFLQNTILGIGEKLGSLNGGLLALSLLQMGVFALALGRACQAAARRAGLIAGVLLLLLFGLHPVFSTLSCSMTKDTFFAAAVLTLSLDMLELLTGERQVSRGLVVRFVLCIIAIAGMRTNGFVVLLALPFFIGAQKPHKAALLLSAGGCAAALAVNFALTLILSPASFPSFQFYSIPAQQLVRANAAGTLTEDQAAELRSWYTDEAGLVVHPHLADPAKGYLDRDRLQREGSRFLSLWADAAKTSLVPYTEAFLMLNIGSWYPDDKSHSTIYPDVSWNDKGYLQTQELEIEGFHTTSLLPALTKLMERICRRNEYQKYPVISLLFSPAVYFFMLLFSAILLIIRGKKRLLPAMLGVFFLWASYLLGPCTLARYMLPVFCLAPVMLITALAESSRSDRK